MKLLFKIIIAILGLITLLFSASIEKKIWAPVMVDDIITFIPYKKSIQPPPVIEPDNSLVLFSGQSQVGIANKSTYKYYKIYAHAGDVVKVDLHNMDANGNLYIKIGSQASLDNYDCKSDNGGETHSTENDSCSLVLDTDTYVYIAVYAPGYGCNTNVQHSIMAYVDSYGDIGPYLNDIQKINVDENKTIYSLTNKLHFPVVSFISGWSVDVQKYNALLTYIASWGYNVVALKETDHFNVEQTAIKIKSMLDTVRDDYHADTSKVAVVGHSSGGGAGFYVMKYIKEQGMANSKSAVISLDGWVTYRMHVADMNELNASTMMMQFGGNDGVPDIGRTNDGRDYTMMQDSKINVSIFNSLTLPELKKEYIIIDANDDHHYLYGETLDILNGHEDLLSPIDTFLDYTLHTTKTEELVDQRDDVIYLDYNTYHYRCDDAWGDYCDINNLAF